MMKYIALALVVLGSSIEAAPAKKTRNVRAFNAYARKTPKKKIITQRRKKQSLRARSSKQTLRKKGGCAPCQAARAAAVNRRTRSN